MLFVDGVVVGVFVRVVVAAALLRAAASSAVVVVAAALLPAVVLFVVLLPAALLPAARLLHPFVVVVARVVKKLLLLVAAASPRPRRARVVKKLLLLAAAASPRPRRVLVATNVARLSKKVARARFESCRYVVVARRLVEWLLLLRLAAALNWPPAEATHVRAASLLYLLWPVRPLYGCHARISSARQSPFGGTASGYAASKPSR